MVILISVLVIHVTILRVGVPQAAASRSLIRDVLLQRELNRTSDAITNTDYHSLSIICFIKVPLLISVCVCVCVCVCVRRDIHS